MPGYGLEHPNVAGALFGMTELILHAKQPAYETGPLRQGVVSWVH